MTWVVVGRARSGDEDDLVFPVEAIGPFEDWDAVKAWTDSAPTFEGRPLSVSSDDLLWLLDLFGVPLRDPDLDDKAAA